jgi:hypothetical protein
LNDQFAGSILADAIGAVAELAVKANGSQDKVEFVRPPSEPEHVYVAVGTDGTISRFAAEPKPRKHNLATVAEVVDFSQEKGEPETTVIWYDRSAVVVILDDATRRDVARVNLQYTPQLGRLLKLEKDKPAFNQKDFVRLLRIDLAGCLTDARLLEWVRSVRFTSTANAAGVMRHGRESMGRDIDDEVLSEQGQDCPEEVLLNVRIFDDPILTRVWPIRCAVEIDAPNQTFGLVPLPLQLHDAIESQVAAIGMDLHVEGGPAVFWGNPQV